MNSREKETRKARKFLTDKQLISFFREAGKTSRVIALKLVNEDLDRGENLDSIFYSSTKDEFYISGGFFVKIKKKSTFDFKISFGFSAGDVGDGGAWDVTFDGDVIKSITEGPWWIA